MSSTVNIPAVITLTQPGAQDFTVTATVDGQSAYTNVITVDSTLSSQFPIQIPSGLLANGENIVNVTAASSELAGSGTFPIYLTPCSAPQVTVSTQASANGSSITVLATITNDGSQPVNNITGSLTGLPPDWSYTSGTVDSIYPNQNQTLTMYVNAGDSSQVQPTLILYSGNQVIYTGQLPLVGSSASGFTGFFTLDTDSATVLFLLIILALAAFPGVLFARSGRRKATSTDNGDEDDAPSSTEPADGTRDYLQRIRNFRQRITGDGTTETSSRITTTSQTSS
jgi:hypothetical protein